MATLLNVAADSLQWRNSSAANVGDAQTSVTANLGGKLSSTRCAGMTAAVTSAIANITVGYIPFENQSFTGTLSVIDANTLAWQSGVAGSSQGAGVAIANGESQFFSDNNPSRYVILSRTSATGLTGGPASLALTVPYNNSFNPYSVTAAQASSGVSLYHCLFLVNANPNIAVQNIALYCGNPGTGSQVTSDSTQLGSSGSGTVVTSTNFNGWPTSGWAMIRTSSLGIREIVYYTSRNTTTLTIPSAGRGLLGTSAAAGASDDVVDAHPGYRMGADGTPGDTVQTIANATTAPGTPPTWKSGVIAADGIPSFSLAVSTGIQAIWFHLQIPAGATSVPKFPAPIIKSYDAA